MKKLLLLAIVVLGISAVSYGQLGAITENATASASATIITPISISHNGGQDLAFGTIIASQDAGTVSVATDGTPTYAGGASTQASIAGTIQAATFTVSGLADATFSISLPGAFEIEGPGGATMTVDGFVSDPDETGTIGAGGSTTISVGAVLHVDANQATGSYSNDTDLTITVSYN